MVLLGREKTRIYRMRNEVRSFINTYYANEGLDADSLVSVQSFIEAKQDEFCASHGLSKVEFNQRLLNQFHEQVALQAEKINGEYYYNLAGMLAIWRELRND